MSEPELKNARADTGPRMTRRINLRLSEEEHDQLIREAMGKTTISSLVHGRIFGAGMRNHDVLRQIAALHTLGMEVRALASNPAASELAVRETLVLVQQEIGKLAKLLP